MIFVFQKFRISANIKARIFLNQNYSRLQTNNKKFIADISNEFVALCKCSWGTPLAKKLCRSRRLVSHAIEVSYTSRYTCERIIRSLLLPVKPVFVIHARYTSRFSTYTRGDRACSKSERRNIVSVKEKDHREVNREEARVEIVRYD